MGEIMKETAPLLANGNGVMKKDVVVGIIADHNNPINSTETHSRPLRKAAVKAQTAIAAASVFENEKAGSITPPGAVSPAEVAAFLGCGETDEIKPSTIGLVSGAFRNSKEEQNILDSTGAYTCYEAANILEGNCLSSLKRKECTDEEEHEQKRIRISEEEQQTTPAINILQQNELKEDMPSSMSVQSASKEISLSSGKGLSPADVRADIPSLIEAAETCATVDAVVTIIYQRLPSYRGNNIHAKLMRVCHSALNVGPFANRKTAVMDMARKLWTLAGKTGEENAHLAAATISVDNLPPQLQEYGLREHPDPATATKTPLNESHNVVTSRPRSLSNLTKRQRNMPAVDLSAFDKEFLDLASSIRECVGLRPGDVPQLKMMMNTGLLAGRRVRYQSRSGEIRLKGVVNENGTHIKCHCTHCHGNSSITPTEFESHAGSADKRPADGIFLEEYDHSLRELLQVIATQVGSAVAGEQNRSSREKSQITLRNSEKLDFRTETCLACHEGGQLLVCDGCYGTYHMRCLGITQCPRGIWLCPCCQESSGTKAGKTGSSTKGKRSRSNAGYVPSYSEAPSSRVHMVAPSQGRPRGTARNFNRNRRLFSGMEGGLKDGERVHYVVRGECKMSGTVVINKNGQSGIIADGKDKTILSCSQFESRAGFAQRRQPYENIFTDDGRNLKAVSNSIPMSDFDEGQMESEGVNESSCGLLNDLDSLIGGCQVCREPDFLKDDFGSRTMILCDQCEREFHVGCLEKAGLPTLSALPEGDWFCNPTCKEIHSRLQNKVSKGQIPVDLQELGLQRIKKVTREIQSISMYELSSANMNSLPSISTQLDEVENEAKFPKICSTSEIKENCRTQNSVDIDSQERLQKLVRDPAEPGNKAEGLCLEAQATENTVDQMDGIELDGANNMKGEEDYGDAIQRTNEISFGKNAAVAAEDFGSAVANLTGLNGGDETGGAKCEPSHDSYVRQRSLSKLRASSTSNGAFSTDSQYTWQVMNGRGRGNVGWSLRYVKEILTESFDPIMDISTNTDLLPLMIDAAQKGDHDFRGSYSLILRYKNKPVVAAIVRICGPTLAELPLIATKSEARRQGHAKVLVRLFEELLKDLGVHRLVLPAAHETIETWKNGFGFQDLSEDLVHAVKHQLRVLVFPGTKVLWKSMDGVTPPTGHYALKILPEPDSLIIRRVLASIVGKIEEEIGDVQPQHRDQESDKNNMETTGKGRSLNDGQAYARSPFMGPKREEKKTSGALQRKRFERLPSQGTRKSNRGTRSTRRFLEDTSDSETADKSQRGTGNEAVRNSSITLGSRTSWASYPPLSGKETVALTLSQVNSGNMSVPKNRCHTIFGKLDNCDVKLIEADNPDTVWFIHHRTYSSQPTQIFLQRMQRFMTIKDMQPGDVITFENVEPAVARIQIFKNDTEEAIDFRQFLRTGISHKYPKRELHDRTEDPTNNKEFIVEQEKKTEEIGSVFQDSLDEIFSIDAKQSAADIK